MEGGGGLVGSKRFGGSDGELEGLAEGNEDVDGGMSEVSVVMEMIVIEGWEDDVLDVE